MKHTSSPLTDFVGHWKTMLGGWDPGHRVTLHNEDLLNGIGQHGWMATLMFALTGKKFTSQQLQLFECIWSIATSFPEPRLWNNRIAALAATARSSAALGTAAAIATSEAVVYGHRPLVASMAFIQQSLKLVEQGKTLGYVIDNALQSPRQGKPGRGPNRDIARLPGFGRPITQRDERIKPLMKKVVALGFDQGRHLQLGFELEQCLIDRGSALRLNIATLMSALCADQDLSTRQYNYFVVLCFSAGILPCGMDAESHPAGSFFPLPCDAVAYTGPTQRQWSTTTAREKSTC
jgi:citrate synthase